MYELSRLLEKIGLSHREASIYLTSLQYGKVSASTLARVTGIPRPSIYDLTEKLMKEGFLKIGKQGGKGYFSAVDPRNIYALLQEKKNTLAQQVDTFHTHLPQFEELKQFTGIMPQVQYYEGKDALEYFFKQVAAAEYSYSIFSLDNLLEHIYFDIDHILENLSNKNIKGAKRIMSHSEKAVEYLTKQINPKIERKILPVGYTMAAEITLFDGVLLQMSFGETPTILEMKHPIYYKAHRTLFDYIRNSLLASEK